MAVGVRLDRSPRSETGCFEPGVRYYKKRVQERDHLGDGVGSGNASPCRPMIPGKVNCIKHASRQRWSTMRDLRILASPIVESGIDSADLSWDGRGGTQVRDTRRNGYHGRRQEPARA